MPNITGYDETGDPNWIQVQFDDGSSTHVQDPSGTYRKEVDDVATKLGFKRPDPLAGAVAGPGGGGMLAGNSLAMPATAPLTAAESAPLRPSAADMQTMEQRVGAPVGAITPMPAGLDEASKHPMVPMGAPAPSLVTPTEQRALAPNPADLASIRRGLGEASRSGGASIEGITLKGNSLAMPAPSLSEPLAGNQLAMTAPGDAPPLPSPTAPVLDLNALPPVDRGGVRRSLADQESAHQHEFVSAQSQQTAQAERERAAAEVAARAGSAEGPSLFMSPGTGPQVTTENSHSSTGLTGADRAKVDAANQSAINARAQADAADTIAKAHQLNVEWGRLTLEQKAKLAEKAALEEKQRSYDTKVEAKTKELQDITSRKIDPAKAFGGDAQWYSFMAGFGDSLQNFGAALAGRGPVANPGQTIDRIINRSIDLQTQQKEQDFKMGRITADQLLAERETIRTQLAAVGQQLTQNQLAKARTQDEKIALGGADKHLEAIKRESMAKAAAATARHESNTESRSTAPGTPGGVTMFGNEKPDWNAVEAHSQRQAGADQVERGLGRLEKATNWTWDEKANNGIGGYIGKDGKPVTADNVSVSGTTGIGQTPAFLAGEGGREVQGSLQDMAAGGAKIKDPVGAQSDKSIEAEVVAMAANTDEGVLRAAERARRNLRGMRIGIDSAYSPGVINASRLRRQQEAQFHNNQPGLPPSRAARPDEL